MTALQTGEQSDEPTSEELELEAYYQLMEDYEPDLEVQALIRESLGLS